MPPKRNTPQTQTISKQDAGGPVEPIWPPIVYKADLHCQTIETDQIITFDNFLSAAECRRLIEMIDLLPLVMTAPPKKGEATRVNHRASFESPSFAETLWCLLQPHLPDLPSFQRHMDPSPRPCSCNSNIRLYKYTTGQYFGPHYDESVKGKNIPLPSFETQEEAVAIDSELMVQSGGKQKKKQTSRKGPGSSKSVSSWSEWTILIYLTGEQDGVTGGQTAFYVEEGVGKGRRTREVLPPLTRGTLLLHRHGKECLLHEGKPVLSGTKYVLRSDLMFCSLPQS